MNITKFEDLPISDEIKRSIAEIGFEEPSPIQAQSIPIKLIRPICSLSTLYVAVTTLHS